MEDTTAITKGNITKTIEEINKIIAVIDKLTDNFSKFRAFVLQQGSVAGLDLHIVNMQTILIETKQAFSEQIELYQILSEQIELNEPVEIGKPTKGVAEAEKTIEKIRLKGYQIKTNKNKINHYVDLLKSMIIIFQSQKTIPQTIEDMFKEIEAELKLICK